MKELKLQDGVDTLGRWMAHHLAELLVAAKNADHAERPAAEDRVANLILRIWAHREANPIGITPLARYAKAAQVLAAIHPKEGFFAPLSLREAPTSVARSLEVFDLASRLAVLSLADILPNPPPGVEEIVEQFLSGEEKDFLAAARATYDLLASGPSNGSGNRKRSAITASEEIERSRSNLLQRLRTAVGELVESSAENAPAETVGDVPRRAKAKRQT
ncbi:hypothetical protein [Hydrogenophaga sp. RAC07]|uniref:hypothetical protein n=1 Tax=Hydrogenophaga sp. RAC07 TaxID=1842537 RepID=UPI0012EA3041|nr:hypothetical protein [Hydrogenophaga sp. RAC07]